MTLFLFQTILYYANSNFLLVFVNIFLIFLYNKLPNIFKKSKHFKSILREDLTNINIEAMILKIFLYLFGTVKILLNLFWFI